MTDMLYSTQIGDLACDEILQEIGPIDSPKGFQYTMQQRLGVAPDSQAYAEIARLALPLSIALGSRLNWPGDEVCWMPAQEKNGHLIVLGDTGSGKTYTLIRIADHARMLGIPTLVIGLHGDMKIPYYRHVLLSSGADSKVGFNPLAIGPVRPGRQGLYDIVGAKASTLRKSCRNMSNQQAELLRAAIMACYSEVGIHENDPQTWSLSPPTMGSVIFQLSQWAQYPSYRSLHKSIQGCIAAITSVFGHPIYNRVNNLDINVLLGGNTILDLSDLDEDNQFLVTDTMLHIVLSAMKSMGVCEGSKERDRIRLFVLIDEVGILARHRDPNGQNRILNNIANEGRKYGIGLILASQQDHHFGADTLSAAACKIMLGSKYIDDSWGAVANPFAPAQLTSGHREEINGASRGIGVFHSGLHRQPVSMKFFPS